MVEVDSRYTDGPVFDTTCDDFCKIVTDDDKIHLETPDGKDRYYTFDDGEFDRSEYITIPRNAVEYPDQFINSVMDNIIETEHDLTTREKVGLRYARRMVSISRLSKEASAFGE